MAITTNLKKSDGVDLGNNLFAGNGTSNGNQTFNIIQSNGVDLGKGWYNKSSCKQAYGSVGFKNSAGTDVGTLLGKYGTLNCTCDTIATISYALYFGCFVYGCLLTRRGLVAVSEIEEGDCIWGADEKWHEVLGVAKSKVGLRKVHTLRNGGKVTADQVLFSGDCAYVPSLKVLNKEAKALQATNGIFGKYSVPAGVMELDGANLADYPYSTPTYSPICSTSFIGYLNGERVLIAGKV